MTERCHPSKMLRRSLGILGVLAALALLIACGERATETPTDLTAPTIGVDSPPGSSTPSGHEGSEGLVLGPDSDRETVYTGALCGPNAPVRDYSLVAINVEISLNRYLDYDHMGRMYVLEDRWEQVREEEAQNRAARLDQAEPAVTIGLQGGDHVNAAIDASDVVIAVGYDVVEYGPAYWNRGGRKKIIHVDFAPAEMDAAYPVEVEIVSDVADALWQLNEAINVRFESRLRVLNRRNCRCDLIIFQLGSDL